MAARSLALKAKGVGTSPVTASFGSCADCPAIWRAESSKVAILREIRRRCFIRCSVVQNLRRVNSEVIAAVLATATTALEDSLTGVRDGGLLLSWPSVDRE